MANIAVDGFATYGVGDIAENTASTGEHNLPAGEALLAGVWAEIARPNYLNTYAPYLPNPQISTLPWAPNDTDLYISRSIASYNSDETTYLNASNYRRVLPVASDPAILSFYYAISFLPVAEAVICGFADSTNTVAAWLVVGSTGNLILRDSTNTTTLAQTTGPVIVAETATHLEMEVSPSGGTFSLNVSGNPALAGSGITFSTTLPVAQIRFLPAVSSSATVYPVHYVGNLIVRDTTGTLNNSIVGDRRVATLMVNSDDVAYQGWVAHPLSKFGSGVLDLTDSSGTAAVIYKYATAGDFNIGASDFTLEAQVRFKAYPAFGVAPILSSWAAGSLSEYDWTLGLGSTAYNNGRLEFRASTDGTLNGATTLISFPWVPVLGQWYHIAVSRASGMLAVYIDGVQLGPVVSDALTYSNVYDHVILGGNYGAATGTSGTVDTHIWMDDVRITIGAARYTSTFTPPSAALPISSTTDTLWSNVALRLTFDSLDFTDLSASTHSATDVFAATVDAPTDGSYNFQTIDGVVPDDYTYISADFLPATGQATIGALPAATDTVTLATKDGTLAATYTWVSALASAYDVLIGTTVDECAANLASAINAGAGAGTTYGSGTLANNDVTAVVDPGAIITVTANVPGTGGNSLASTATGTAVTWGGATLSGGVDIPSYSQFSLARLPSDATQVDSITLAVRAIKTDAGLATVQPSLAGIYGGVISGAAHSVSTAPTVYMDTIENDPDNPTNPLSPVIVSQAKVRIDRTS